MAQRGGYQEGAPWGTLLTQGFSLCGREEVSALERSKYKFSPLPLPEELPALFHGEPPPPRLLNSSFPKPKDFS